MQRYLTSYSKNYLRVRDRKLDIEKTIYITDRETADVVQDAIKSTNYHLTKRKNGRVTVKSISDLPLKLSDSKPQWGDMLPEKIIWEREILEKKEKQKQNELNRILFTTGD